MRTLAYRRHQASRAMSKALRITRNWNPDQPEVALHIARRIRSNRKPCSCEMCGNPRRSQHHSPTDRLTMPERRALLAAQESQ